MIRAGYLALVFFGLLAYVNAIRHPFVHDDVVFILQNPHIAELNHWVDAFKLPSASGDVNIYYRPVLEILYRFEFRLFGPNPPGYHLFNIIVHIINGLLLFSLLQRVNLSTSVAWVIALLFLIHPVQTEAVSCIAGISNLWMALGVLLALHAYLNRWYLITLLFFVMAFLSKEQAVLFVPLLMVIDISLGRKDLRSWFFWVASAFVLLGLRQIVTGASLFKELMASPGELCLRLAAIPRDIEMYVRLIFCPYDLHYYRSTDILQSNRMAWVVLILSLLVIMTIIYKYPKSRWSIILGLGWFLAALLPVLNITPLINEYSFILTAEHFLYLPIVGILIVAVVAADYFIKYFRRLIAGLVIASCLLLTWYQNNFWRSEIALFERMLVFEPNFGRGHLLLAKAYYFHGRPYEAEGHFEKSFMIMNLYAKKTANEAAKKFYLGFMKEILFDWAQNESAMGHWSQALGKYKHAVAIDGGDASLYNNMAFVYLHMGDKKSAQSSLEQALHIDPSFARARTNLNHLTTP